MDMNQIPLLHDNTDRVTSSDAIDSGTVFPARQRLKAKDKILQFNGRGTVQIKDFYANTYGTLIRTCDNCPGNGRPRHITISGSMGKGGGELCGINSNYGDTCRVSNSCQDSNHSCTRYEGNDQRLEPPTLGSGHDGVSCFLTSFSRC
ncbi:hypothetical protein BN1708_001930, partial [Verticillium longisporum]